jgi:hypothetical protein
MNNMMIYSTDWYGSKSFRMMPITEDCPFNEVIFDPTTKVLAVISKDQKEKPQMMPKLNEKGQLIPLKVTVENGQPKYVEERRMMDTYYEYYLDQVDDIKAFINQFAINPEHSATAIINAPVEAA